MLIRSRLPNANAFSKLIRGFAVAVPVLAAVLSAPNAFAQSVNVTVNWNTALKTIDSGAWGIDNPAFMTPSATSDPNWMNQVNAITLKKPLIRIHGWGMLAKDGTGWLNADGSWNATTITNALTPVINAGYKVMIDVPDGPNTGSGPDPDLTGNPDKIAAWMASLVQIVNVTDHFNVKYWEFPNERDPYCTSGALTSAQMSTLLSKTSRAMKLKDNTIKFGGPATCWINGSYIQDSISGILSDIDFVTCHIYGGDGTLSSPQTYYDNAQGDSTAIADMRTRMNTISPGKYIPIYLDEYNISYNSSPYNKDSDGAVYDVLEATGAIHSGGDTTQFWECSDTDDWHSLIPNHTSRYPISNNWTLLNQYFYGQEMSATTSNRSLVDKFAAKSTSGSTTTYSLVLVNRSDSTQTVGLSYSNFAPSSLNKYVIDSTGYSGPTAIGWPISGGLTMSPRSVAYLIGTSTSGTGGVVSINSGGPATGSFIADADFSGGATATNWTGTIDTSGAANPAPQTVYQSERYGNNTYTIGGLTPGANYTVRLHFCENYWTAAGKRVFNVSINNISELSNFDIFATAGAGHKAVTRQYTVAANSSGQMVIVYTTVTDNALSSGVEVVAASSAPPAFVQVNSNDPVSASSIAVAYNSAQTAGNLNIVVIGWNNTTGTVSSVHDSAGNTYSRAIGPTVDSDAQQSIYYASNIRAGSNTVTVTMSTSVAYPDVRVLEYSGVSTLDKTAGASGTGTAANSGSATTTTARELIFTANTCDWNTIGVGAGFTNRITTIDGNIAADKSVSSTGSYSGTATLSNTTPWTMQMATFK